MNRVHSAASGSIPVQGRHVCLFQVLLMGLAFGFMAAWIALAAWLLVAVLAYGLFGAEINPPSFRFVSFVFSAVFVIVTVVGSGSWAVDKVRTFLKNKDATHDR